MFGPLVLARILGVVGKIVVGVLAVGIGWRATGALGGFLAAQLIILFYSWRKLAPAFSRSLPIDSQQIISYSGSVFGAICGLTLLYNLDVILARHFLLPQDAGFYAAISLLGKIVFFINSSMGVILFPVVVWQKTTRQNRSFQLLPLLGILAGSILLVIGYFVFPESLIKIIFGPAYLAIADYLGWIGVIFVLYSLVNLLSLYYLAQEKKDFVAILLAGVALEGALLGIYHQNISQILQVMGGVLAGVLLALAILPQLKKIPLGQS